MKRQCLFIFLLLALQSFAVHSQSIYYCLKNGKKVVSDQSCETQGAVHQKRVDVQDMPPVNASNGLTSNEVSRSHQVDQRLNNQRQVDEQNRQHEILVHQQQKAANQTTCNRLESDKKNIQARQRAFSTDGLTAQLKYVNDELFRLRCETL